MRRLPRPTPAGWRVALLAAGLAAAAVNTGNNLIYLMFSLLAAALPVSVALGVWNLSRVRCTLRLPSAPRVGSPFTIELELDANRRWAAARAVAVRLVTDGEPPRPVVVERLAAGERTRVQLTARGATRGPWRIPAVRLSSMFPLGLVWCERRLEQDRELVIVPARGGARASTGVAAPVAGAVPSRRLPGTEYAGLRRASAEDDVRKVDWKVTARRGFTVVRETAGESAREHHWDVVTRCAGNPPAARRAFEERLARRAARAEAALEHGDTVHLTVDGAARRSYAGRRGVLPLLLRLARLEPTDEDGSPLPPLDVPRPPAPTNPLAMASAPRRSLRRSALAATAIGSIALAVAGGIGAIVLALLLAAVVATGCSDRLLARPRSLVGRLWRVAASFALVGYALDVLVVRHDLLAASISLTVFITLYALFNVGSPNDDRRLLLVSLLHMVLAVAMTTEVAIAAPLASWLFAAVHGLMAWTAIPGSRCRAMIDTVFSRRPRYAAPALAVWSAVLASCLVLFLVVPHFGTGAFRPALFRGSRSTGFSDRTTLGDIGRIKLDRSKVMEIEVSGDAGPEDELRWRGLALNEFDGRTWTRTYTPYTRLVADGSGELHPRSELPPGAGTVLRQEVRLEPSAAVALFAAAEPTSIVSSDIRRLGQDGFGNLEFPAKPGRRLAYSVSSRRPVHDADRLRAAGDDDPPDVRSANLLLPELDPRVAELARRITEHAATRYDAALAIEQWLASRLRYSLDVDDRGAADPLARFLFDGMAGHCEYFATAMVVLVRERGIPARFVAGYLRGERSGFGRRYVVRQSNAHSWVEVYFPGTGWVPFDPTPPDGRTVEGGGGLLAFAGYLHSSITRLWDDYLVGIDLDDQARGLLVLADAAGRLGRSLARLPAALGPTPLRAVVAVAALAALLLALRRPSLRIPGRGRARRERARETPRFYRAVADLLSRRGLSRGPGETPREFSRRAAPAIGPRAAERLQQLTALYYRVRFDGLTSERQVSRIAKALVADVRAGLRVER